MLLAALAPPVTAPDPSCVVVPACLQDGTEKSKRVFVTAPVEVGQTEAEEIGVEHLLRDVKDATLSTLASDVGAKLQALQGLRGRLSEVRGMLGGPMVAWCFAALLSVSSLQSNSAAKGVALHAMHPLPGWGFVVVAVVVVSVVVVMVVVVVVVRWWYSSCVSCCSTC